MREDTVNEVLQFVEENDVKFVRLAFCDLFGTLKNISIMAEELPAAFAHGVSFDASAVDGFMNIEESDLLLFPDPGTVAVLPWRPQQGRVIRFYCDIRHPDGTPFMGDGRHILQGAIRKAADMGYVCKVGAECEFYLFELDENGEPTETPQDKAGYLDVAPLDKGENIRREICLNMEQMGLAPESSHHEKGPGQNEIVFKYHDALETADNLITFKSVVKTAANRNGLHASFMPKPMQNQSGSGLHLHLSLFKQGQNIFKNEKDVHSPQAEGFIQGILERISEITAFSNPLVNSYVRFGEDEAPKYITWSHENRSQLIRIPPATGQHARMELRSPDPACNPYVTLALLIYAGLEGIEEQKKLCPPTNLNLWHADAATLRAFEHLPDTLEQAILLARNSKFIARVMPAAYVEKFAGKKLEECRICQQAGNAVRCEKELYFESI